MGYPAWDQQDGVGDCVVHNIPWELCPCGGPSEPDPAALAAAIEAWKGTIEASAFFPGGECVIGEDGIAKVALLIAAAEALAELEGLLLDEDVTLDCSDGRYAAWTAEGYGEMVCNRATLPDAIHALAARLDQSAAGPREEEK